MTKLSIFIACALVSWTTLGAGPAKEYHNLLPKPKANLEKSQAPGAVSLVQPQAFAKLKAGAITLEWSTANEAQAYHVQVAKDPQFKWLIKDEHFVNGSSIQVTDLPVGQVFWRVAAKKPGNMAAHWKSPFTQSSFEVTE